MHLTGGMAGCANGCTSLRVTKRNDRPDVQLGWNSENDRPARDLRMTKIFGEASPLHRTIQTLPSPQYFQANLGNHSDGGHYNQARDQGVFQNFPAVFVNAQAVKKGSDKFQGWLESHTNIISGRVRTD